MYKNLTFRHLRARSNVQKFHFLAFNNRVISNSPIVLFTPPSANADPRKIVVFRIFTQLPNASRVCHFYSIVGREFFMKTMTLEASTQATNLRATFSFPFYLKEKGPRYFYLIIHRQKKLDLDPFRVRLFNIFAFRKSYQTYW